MDPNNIHDKFVRETFSDPERAKVFLSEFLPGDLLATIELSSLSVSKESYMTEELTEYFSDLIMEVALKGPEEEKMDIALLFEHKSSPDKNVLIQVGYYLFAHYFKSIRYKQPFKAVIPIIYYQGKRKWEAPQLSAFFKSHPDTIQQYLPKIEHVLISLRDIPNDRIATIRDAMLAVALSAQKLRFEPAKLQVDLIRIFKLFPYEGIEWNYFEMTLVYILQATDLSEKDLEQTLKIIPPPIKERIMTTYDRILLQGIEKGMEKGIAQGIEKEKIEVIINSNRQGLEASLTSNIVSLPEERVLQIIKAHGLFKQVGRWS